MTWLVQTWLLELSSQAATNAMQQLRFVSCADSKYAVNTCHSITMSCELTAWGLYQTVVGNDDALDLSALCR